MGVKSLTDGLVPTRFLCMMAHLTILISILIRRDIYVNSCDPVVYPQISSLSTQFIIALSLSIAFLIMELSSFMFGITLFNSFQSTISTLIHSSAAIALSTMIFYRWCSIYFWIVFAICSCVPLFIEFMFLCGVCLLKKTIN